MTRPGPIVLMCLALVASGAAATAQTVTSTPVEPAYVPPVAAEAEPAQLQFTVDVTAEAMPFSGARGDHFLSFSVPIQIPGASLAPGTYVFRRVAPSVIQVLSADYRQSYAMFSVNPTTRAAASHTYQVRIQNVARDNPMRLVGFFVPDQQQGYEPIYTRIPGCERILREMSLPTAICVS